MTSNDAEALDRIRAEDTALEAELHTIASIISAREGRVCSTDIVNAWKPSWSPVMERRQAFARVQRYLRNALARGALIPLPLEHTAHCGLPRRYYKNGSQL